jgi:hypothetical protein
LNAIELKKNKLSSKFFGKDKLNYKMNSTDSPVIKLRGGRVVKKVEVVKKKYNKKSTEITTTVATTETPSANLPLLEESTAASTSSQLSTISSESLTNSAALNDWSDFQSNLGKLVFN